MYQTLGPRSFYSMDGRSLLSYFDADDDYYPIAIMTANGLRVIEISNDDTGMVGIRFDSADPERYEFFFSGSSVVLLPPSDRLLAVDPPYLIQPVLERLPGEGADFYSIMISVVNASGSLADAEMRIPDDIIFWEQ